MRRSLLFIPSNNPAMLQNADVFGSDSVIFDLEDAVNVTEKDMKIATVPAGYGDGYPRYLSNKGEVLIRGTRCKILGRVCMDQLMLDVTSVKGVREGDYITLIGSDKGESITADELAKNNSTIGYEMICAIGERVPRFYIKDHEIVFVKDNIVSYEISE